MPCVLVSRDAGREEATVFTASLTPSRRIDLMAKTINRIESLTPEQREFICSYRLPDGDTVGDNYVYRVCQLFHREFGLRVGDATVRRLLTQEHRRNGNGSSSRARSPCYRRPSPALMIH